MRTTLAKIAATGILGVLPLLLSCNASAALTALSMQFDGGQAESNDTVVGWEFRTGPHPLHVVALGVHDSVFTGPEGGLALAFSHVAGIFRRDTQALVGQATVPAGSLATLEAGFRYVPSSFVLLADTDYVAAATWPGVPQDTDFPEPVDDDYAFFPANNTIAIPSPQISLGASGGARQIVSSVMAFPTFRYDHAEGIAGPNFKFEVLAIPEPSIWSTLAIGLVAGVCRTVKIVRTVSKGERVGPKDTRVGCDDAQPTHAPE
jgi:hypothetical protein